VRITAMFKQTTYGVLGATCSGVPHNMVFFRVAQAWNGSFLEQVEHDIRLTFGGRLEQQIR
jgi:hypothetical protein